MTATVLHGDAAEIARTLEPGSVNLVLTSPPYADRRQDIYGGVPPENYVDWFQPYARAFAECLAADGNFVLNIKEGCDKGQRLTYVYDLALKMRDWGWRLVDEFIWVKPNPIPGKWNGRLKDGWERCYHFTKAPGHKFRPDNVRKPIAERTKELTPEMFERFGGQRRQSSTGSGFGISMDNFGRSERTSRTTGSGFGTTASNFTALETALPSNVLTAGVAPAKNHPAVFPQGLPDFFIKLMTDPGDLVFDPFAGSGTTLQVAQKLDRRSVGCDTSAKYVRLMQEKLTQSTQAEGLWQ